MKSKSFKKSIKRLRKEKKTQKIKGGSNRILERSKSYGNHIKPILQEEIKRTLSNKNKPSYNYELFENRSEIIDIVKNDLIDKIQHLVKVISENIPTRFTTETYAKEITINDKHFDKYLLEGDIPLELQEYLNEIDLNNNIIKFKENNELFIRSLKGEYIDFRDEFIKTSWLNGLIFILYCIYYSVIYPNQHKKLELKHHVAFVLEGKYATIINNILSNLEGVISRESSHLKNMNKVDYGIDVNLLLPKDYKHILFFYYKHSPRSNQFKLFIKPESHGVTRWGDWMAHGYEYMITQATNNKLTEKKPEEDTEIYKSINEAYQSFIISLGEYLNIKGKNISELDVETNFKKIKYLGEIKLILSRVIGEILNG